MASYLRDKIDNGNLTCGRIWERRGFGFQISYFVFSQDPTLCYI